MDIAKCIYIYIWYTHFLILLYCKIETIKQNIRVMYLLGIITTDLIITLMIFGFVL